MENSKSVMFVDFTPFGVNDPKELKRLVELFQQFQKNGKYELFPNPKNLKDSNDLGVKSDIGKFVFHYGDVGRIIHTGDDYYVVEYSYPETRKGLINKEGFISEKNQIFFIEKLEDLFYSTSEQIREKVQNLEKCKLGDYGIGKVCKG